MKRAQVCTTWVGTGVTSNDARRPKIAGDFALQSVVDVTGQPAANLIPDPNLYVVEIVAADAVMDTIEVSAEYGDGLLWVEEA